MGWRSAKVQSAPIHFSNKYSEPCGHVISSQFDVLKRMNNNYLPPTHTPCERARKHRRKWEACPVLCLEYWRKFAVVFLLAWQMYSAILFDLQTFKLRWGGYKCSSSRFFKSYLQFMKLFYWNCKNLDVKNVERLCCITKNGFLDVLGPNEFWRKTILAHNANQLACETLGKLLLQMLWWWLFQYAGTCCRFWQEF